MATRIELREQKLKAVKDFQDFALDRKEEDGSIAGESREEYEALRTKATDAIKEWNIDESAAEMRKTLDNAKAREAAIKATGVDPSVSLNKQVKNLPFQTGERTLTLRIPGNYMGLEYSVGTATKGAELVPTDLLARLLNRLTAIDGLRAAGAEVITTESGNPMNIPTLTQYTAPGNAAPTAESTAYDTTEATFGQVGLNVYKYTGKVPVTEELLQDAIFDVAGMVGNHIGDAIAQKTERRLRLGLVLTSLRVSSTLLVLAAMLLRQGLRLLSSSLTWLRYTRASSASRVGQDRLPGLALSSLLLR